MEKFGSCVWICENFLFWWGIEIFFFLFLFVCGGGALVLRIFCFLVWKFLVMWVLVMEIDELNFCVAEPQESR